METDIKNELKKMKSCLEKQIELKTKLENKNHKLLTKLHKMNDIQLKLFQYNDYRRNIHIAIGAVTLIATFFLTKKILNQEILNAILVSLGTSTITTLGIHSLLKNKINKLKKENPGIDFKNSNYDENEKKRQKMLQTQLTNNKKISDINGMIKECEHCYEELINNKDNNTLYPYQPLNTNEICIEKPPIKPSHKTYKKIKGREKK